METYKLQYFLFMLNLLFILCFSNTKKKIILTDNNLKIIRTIPGEIHSIKKIGKKDLIVLVWSNEIFDVNSPDTYS